jgi:hypothetical protein
VLSVQITGVVGYCAGPRSRASVAESMTKPRQPNDAGLTVPCQVHALAPIRCRRPVDNSVQNCGTRTKAQGFHRSRVRLCEIRSIAGAIWGTGRSYSHASPLRAVVRPSGSVKSSGAILPAAVALSGLRAPVPRPTRLSRPDARLGVILMFDLTLQTAVRRRLRAVVRHLPAEVCSPLTRICREGLEFGSQSVGRLLRGLKG